MENYSDLEKFISSLISRFPKLKVFAKKFYERINLLFHKKKYLFKSEYNITQIDSTNQSTFFGYYDKSPENYDGNKVIYYKTNYDTKNKPSSNYPIEIILKCLLSEKINSIDKTFSYNWQQGAKMMWISNNEFIYNVYSKYQNKYHSKIYNIKTKKFKIIDWPIYDCYKDKYALGLNFNRLRDLRPDYGYKNSNEKSDYEDYSKDGIYEVSLKKNNHKLLITLSELIDLKYLKTMKYAKHKVNHIMISPNGKSFIFMHRWHRKSGLKYDRLLVYNYNSNSLKIISDEGGISHCCWKDNNTIIGYLTHNGKFDFYEINIVNGSINQITKKLENFGDGHPTFIKNKLLFDSYPNRSRIKNLFIYSYDNNKIINLGDFYEPLSFYKESRCDLHPRFSSDFSAIYFDSVHSGKRRLYKLNLNSKK
tara:strand:- start:266 stop:1528 length:1263 start_codon:yes stop_codon:yes gene_type:complete